MDLATPSEIQGKTWGKFSGLASNPQKMMVVEIVEI